MMLQSDDINGAPAMDFDAWRALLRSNCGRDVEVTTPNSFAGWIRPFNACGLEATSVKIRWGAANRGCSDYRAERRYRDVRCDGADHYLIMFQVAGQTEMTQIDQAAQLAEGDVALVDAARPVTYLSRFKSPHWLTLRLPRRLMRSHLGFEPQGVVSRQATRASRLLFDLVRDADMEAASSSADMYMQCLRPRWCAVCSVRSAADLTLGGQAVRAHPGRGQGWSCKSGLRACRAGQ
jgi:AraC family transcriptional regulator, positive regulator of tynA and feaB